jgi:integrase
MQRLKGRPITAEEFERMLDKVPQMVGDDAAPSWKYLLRGLWESALRIDEVMHLSWDLPATIRPMWRRGRLPVLEIPAEAQKNDTEEAIPLLPGFETVLLETPEADRTACVFNPASLQPTIGKRAAGTRPDAGCVGKVVARIGEAAGVVVVPAEPTKGKGPKCASAHDLGRSCAERLLDAGVPP